MKIALPRFWILAAVQVILALVVISIAFYFRTEALLAGPGDGDLYAHTWGFQLAVFALLWVPATLLATGIVLVVERRLLKPYYLARRPPYEA